MTLADVAKVAGVSAITASRALNTPNRVSQDAQKRVRDAVERTGYVPNMVAGGLASSRSRLVAALVPTIAGPVFLETVQALTEALAESGYQLMLGQSGYGGAREDALLDAIIGRRPDGIVLTGIMHSAEGRRRLLAAGIPVVETWDLTPTPIDMLVGFSHEKVGHAVAEYLFAQGRRKLAIVTADDHRAGLRRKGFEETATRLGIASIPACVVPAPTTLGNGRAGLTDLLAHHTDIDAIFCSSDLLALGVLTEAQSRNMPIPGRFAVVGFGDLGFAGDTHPALTTVRIDGNAIGRQAARFIVERAEGKTQSRNTKDRVIDLGFSIVKHRQRHQRNATNHGGSRVGEPAQFFCDGKVLTPVS